MSYEVNQVEESQLEEPEAIHSVGAINNVVSLLSQFNNEETKSDDNRFYLQDNKGIILL